MPKTLSSREFNQDTSGAKKACQSGPVFITDRGKPSHVLMRYEDYQRVIGKQKTILDLVGMPGLAEIEFEPEKIKRFTKPSNLS
ncbi:MAG: hypothetical protein RLZZ365_931 [Pseudomonadota bacterium]|jgi:PHD/YefM family antitoxin component YafN of YafNO toxin-antitoxin module